MTGAPHPVRDLDAPGTDEAAWRASGVLDARPLVEPSRCRPAGRAVVVAPHPDDEVLGVGGVLAAWAADGVPVTVVAATDGEGSHPGSPTLSPAGLAERRRDERHRALERLGLGAADVVALGLPDGGVAGHVDALTARLTDLLRPGDTLLAPVPGDGHPDHDAVADAAGRAAAATGAGLLRYAVWLWHWARPDDPDVDWDGAVRIALPDRCRRAKQDAVACFTTQIAPLSDDPRDGVILPPAVLARLLREVEVLWETP